jgi:hypothetical protein
MDGPTFDSITRLAQGASTRRGAVTSAIGGATASALAVAGLATLGGSAEAKKNKKKKKKKCPACQPLAAGTPCSTNLECCTNETDHLCAVSSTATSVTKTCCGGVGTPCTSSNQCCNQFSCKSGICDS